MDSQMSQLMAFLDSLGLPRPSGPNDPRLRTLLSNMLNSTSSLSSAVSPERQFKEQLARAKAQHEQEKRLGPGPRPHTSRAAIAQTMAESRTALENARQEKESMILTTFVGFPKHTSNIPLEQLTRTRLSEMRVRKTHVGTYLICRTFTWPTRLVAVQVGIEDPDGDVEICNFYNYPETLMAPMESLDELFPLGSILAIREPTLKMNAHGTAAVLRVDSPSDLIVLRPSNPLIQGIVWRTPSPSVDVLQTAVAWKERGNSHFKQGRFYAASLAYTRGLEIEPGAHLLLLNRSLAYLQVEYFSSALADAERVSSDNVVEHANKAKALFRWARACYGLQQFPRARDLFRDVLAIDPRQRDSSMWLRRCEARMREASKGDSAFDWVKMCRDCQENPILDVSDWLGPVRVALIPTRGGGRGMVTTRAVQVGELLMVSKAYASSFTAERQGDGHSIIMGLNLLTNRAETRSQVEVLNRVIARVMESPATASDIYGLYAGPSYPAPPLDYPGIAESRNSVVGDPALDVDVLHIEHICNFNAFAPHRLRPAAFTNSGSAADEMTQPSALYLLPSLFNHACAGTASYIFFGDVMAIRSTQALKEGAEITVPYSAEASFTERKMKLGKHMESCDCWLCHEERRDGEDNYTRRVAILADLQSDIKERKRPSIDRARELIQLLGETYRPGAGVVRPAMAHVHHTLAHALSIEALDRHALYPDSARADIDALEACGITVTDKSLRGRLVKNHNATLPIATARAPILFNHAPMIALMITAAFCSMGDEYRARRWLAAAQWLYNVTYGGGEPLFRLMHKDILEKTGIREYLSS